jgi:hypothetical protein
LSVLAFGLLRAADGRERRGVDGLYHDGHDADAGILVNGIVRRIAPPALSVGLVMLSFFGVITVITKGQYGSLLNSPSSYVANALMIMGALCWVIYTLGAGLFPLVAVKIYGNDHRAWHDEHPHAQCRAVSQRQGVSPRAC